MSHAELGKHKLDRALDGAIRRLMGTESLTAKIFADEVMKFDPPGSREEVEDRAAFVLRELFDPAAVIEELCAKSLPLSQQDERRLKSAKTRLALAP